ncbi:MAG: DUF2147 domain-containing protein [Bacteroidetes bacterium]|nr:DUF2147 domain-containing protein [Bacteroidota bacterium]
MKLELKSGTINRNASILRKLFFLAVLFVTSSSFAQTKSDDILGTWLTSDGERKISVYKQNEKYFGKIIWAKSSDKKDEIGKIVMRDLEFSEGGYDDGSFIMPTEKHSADCSAILKKGNVLQITIYHGMKIFGHSIYLSKTS